METAKLVEKVIVSDLESKGLVEIVIFKHNNGGMFGIDASYLDQCFEDDKDLVIQDPLNEEGQIILTGL